MSSRNDPVEIIDVLMDRIGLVECLAGEPADKRELVDELGVSRSTVDRATRELETAGLVTYAEGRFELTPLGRMAATEFEGIIETIQLRQRLEPFFRWIPDVAFEFDLRLLADAELLLAKPGNPYSMINEHVRLIEESGHSRGLLPFTGLHAVQTTHERLTHNDARAELVVEPEVAHTFQTNPKYGEYIESMAATGRFEVSLYEDTIPYALALIDDTVQIVVADGDQPRALLETDSEDMYEWAERKYREYEANATQVIP